MQPVYVKNADPTDRNTWMDKFIALEPVGGFRAVVEATQYRSSSEDLAAFFSRLPAPVRHRRSTFAPKRQQVRS
jgi:hypothetical protein